MKKPKKETWPKHKMGKVCGYDEYEDGSIKIAATHYQVIDDALRDEGAVNDLIAAMTKSCHALMIPIHERKKRFWDGVMDDYGLDRDNYDYFYNEGEKIIKMKLKSK